MRVAIGVDIGGTKIALGVVADDGRLLASRQIPTPARQGPEAVLDAVAGELTVLVADTPSRPSGIGVSTGGIVDVKAGRVVASTDLITGWAGTEVAAWLADRSGLAVRVDNDGNAFALAEHCFGAARGVDDALCVAVGTGIGGGIVLGGRLRRGPHHLAGELGHLPAPTTQRCSCGKVGHAEAASSGPAIVAAYRCAGGAGSVASAAAVAERAGTGDEVAATVIGDAGRMLGEVLAGPALSLDVSVVVVGGGVAAGMGAGFLVPLRQALRSALPYGYRPAVAAATLGHRSAVVGAASLVLED